MAIFLRTNGDAQPVFALDIQNGPAGAGNANVIATGSGNTVQPQGPKLDFFQLTVPSANAAGGEGVNGAVSNVLSAIQQLGTVAMYQVDSGNLISVAVYPTGAFATSGTLTSQPANISALVAQTTNVAVVTATNTGFKLAAS